ncbi:hypothetical protein MY4824_003016 [Beauveria thailandica]
MHLNQIQHWLDATELISNHDNNDRKAKRRRLNLPITPPSSDTRPHDNMDSPSRGGNPSKRPFDDGTPRPKRAQTSISRRSCPSLSSASDHSPSSSRRLGRTPSPQKQLRKLQLDPSGLDVRGLSEVTGNRPLALQTLLDDIESFADGQGIVARDTEEGLTKAANSDPRFRWALRPGALHVSGDEGLVGRTPSPGAVRKVMKAALECDAKHHPEANWNLEVHQRILDMAFRPAEESEIGNLIDFMGSSTASIIRDYGIPTLLKNVDFCVYIEPESDSSSTFEAGAAYARMAMPQEIVNFTDFAPLYDRFIALSIETQKPSEDFEAAQLQLGVWDMAHWAFLRRLSGLRASVTGTTGATTSAVEQQMPEFLPGIIVQGHNWFLVITTMEGDKTVLWHSVAIGSTAKPRGIYQIVRTLQYLERWAKDVHWPWLKAMVEGIAAGVDV